MDTAPATLVKRRDLLRFTTAGSVDDGKSTLIGRMLFDSKQIFQDQLDQLEHASRLRGEENVNLALLTDGLRAEREQGITIDVAYRYFSTARRKFIIADTPGHEQYTRNMVTGASTADLAVVLIDARHGVLTQSRRHGIIASLLGIPHVVVCVNKMDLVAFDKARFDEIAAEYREFAGKLNIHDLSFIPVSALLGDNVVNRSDRTPWYLGPPLLQFLEDVTISADRNLVDFRFPVQYVIRPNQDFRGFAGQVVSGTVRVGDEILALPGMRRSTVKAITCHRSALSEAGEGQSVILSLDDEIDISRGDMIVRRHNIPEVENEFEATVAWLDDRLTLDPGRSYLLRHTTRMTPAVVDEILYRLDVNTLHRQPASRLQLNEIARVRLTASQPIFFDPYDRNRATGAFVLVDPDDFRTVGAGMIRHSSLNTIRELKRESGARTEHPPSPDTMLWAPGRVSPTDRVARHGHEPLCVWLAGGDARTRGDLAIQVEKDLFDRAIQVVRLTDENTRAGLNADLRDHVPDRQEALRRHLHLARLLTDLGQVVICACDAGDAGFSEMLRSRFPSHRRLAVALDDAMASADLALDACAGDVSQAAGILIARILERIQP